MKIKGIDHIVLTVADIEKSREFYEKILGLEYEVSDGKSAVLMGQQKINLHKRPGEFQPAAKKPTEGSGDICLEVDGSIGEAYDRVRSYGAEVELGPVDRVGANGEMQSIYLRDPDGNLVELCSYERQ